MKKNCCLVLFATAVFIINGCHQIAETKEIKKDSRVDSSKVTSLLQDTSSMITPSPNKASDFIPVGFTIFDSVRGDVDNDQLEDLILIIKGTDKKYIVKDENRGMSDRNRRGIIVLVNKSGQYVELVKNYHCFSSENEDGGVYFPPELGVEVKKNNLVVNYAHGRYGYWSYTFRVRNKDMELIGYEASSTTGPLINRETSINFLTRKKQERENINQDAGPGAEKFKETWSPIKLDKPIILSQIKDFDEMKMDEL